MFLLLVILLVGTPLEVGIAKIQTAGSETSSDYSNLESYLKPSQVEYQPEIQPPANTSSIQAVILTLNSTDVFAVNNPATLEIFMAVNNPKQVATINVLITPAELNLSALSGNDVAMLVVNQLNARQGVNFRNVTSLMGGTFPANFTQDGSFKFVVVIALPNMVLEPPLETGPFTVYPYTDKLQAVSNQIDTRALLNQSRSTDTVEGLTWIVSGLAILQLFFLVIQTGMVEFHVNRSGSEEEP